MDSGTEKAGLKVLMDLDAVQVADLHCVHLAACKAMWADVSGGRKTKSLHAELVFDLSGSKHV